MANKNTEGNMTLFKTWHEAYNHIAELLNDFYESHKENEVAQEIYYLLKDKPFYERNSRRFFQYPPNENPPGLDPIQIFASFNYSGIRTSSRIDLINDLFDALGSEYKVNAETNFEGIPTPIITNIIYNRKIENQNRIWHVFHEVTEKKLEGLSEDTFQEYKNWYGVGLTAFTIFLFWINSAIFLPLDRNTNTLVIGLRIADAIPANYTAYRSLCQKVLKSGTVDSIRFIVKDAYDPTAIKSGYVSTEVVSVVENVLAPSDVNSRLVVEDFSRFRKQNFKIIAIRPTGKEDGEKQKHLKNLQKDQLYVLNHNYAFFEGDQLSYKQSASEELYNSEDLRVSISSIVGKNGSGKSSITELILLILNRLSVEHGFPVEGESLEPEEIYADLFIKTDFIYKISVGSDIHIWAYTYDDAADRYSPLHHIVNGSNNLGQFNFQRFFYSIIVNYSLYALNSKHLGSWINPLFNKNDGYQIPVVLNPKRYEGDIRVNVEDGLSKARLLATILNPDKLDPETRTTTALVHEKHPVFLEISIDEEKQRQKRKKYFKKDELDELDQVRIDSVIALFHLNIRKTANADTEVKEYIYCKLISMREYAQFLKYEEVFIEGSFNMDLLPAYISAVMLEPSHVSFKIKQAVNYLENAHFFIKKNNLIFDCAEEIGRIKSQKFNEKEEAKVVAKTIELIPPSLFKTNVWFKGEHSFDDLSSGEKQQIISINTIAYHLANLDSIQQVNENIKYNFVNIIFDEVELYFHPDMQRTYIKHLYDRINSLQLEFIKDVNIIFVTHSPFILSDISSSNLLKLEDGRPDVPTEQTFGANVHDLLANDFFMENGFMGEYAKTIIQDLVIFLSQDVVEETKMEWTEEKAKETIAIIGEPILKVRLEHLFDKKFVDHDKLRIQQRIEELQAKLKT
jgi:flagellar basal body rod protein FlgC